jgi:hypothetical protein
VQWGLKVSAWAMIESQSTYMELGCKDEVLLKELASAESKRSTGSCMAPTTLSHPLRIQQQNAQKSPCTSSVTAKPFDTPPRTCYSPEEAALHQSHCLCVPAILLGHG